jgi:hypothetical protein|tara:strand:- start:3421 stop:3831 length:411 start_codon:yes stop_codon:yes gene_type:complete
LSVPAKRELTTKQKIFLDELIDNGGNVQQAVDKAGYAKTARSWLIPSLKNEIIERTKLHLAANSVKAANRIVEGLDSDGTLASSQMDTRLKAAGDILDRIGISKRQEIYTESKVLHGVVLIPAKKQQDSQAWQDLN